MPEIIGRDEDKAKQVTCKNCGSILRYWPREVQEKRLYSFGEYDGTYYWIVCPECNEGVPLKGK